MRFLPKNWVWFGILSVLLGLALILGTGSWRWLGAVAVLVGLVLVLIGPPDLPRAENATPRDCPSGHSCCMPRSEDLAQQPSPGSPRR